MKCSKELIITGILGGAIFYGFQGCNKTSDSKKTVQETREALNVQFTNDVPLNHEYKSASISVEGAPKEAFNNRFMIVTQEQDGEVIRRDTLKVVLIQKSQ